MGGFLVDLLMAVLKVGLPLLALTTVLVGWALRSGTLRGDTVSDVQRDIESLGKRRSDKKDPQKLNPVHEKWFTFGGGFYGLVAFYTWLLIEWADVADFLGGLGRIVVRVDIGGLISLLINLLIESIMNFVAAIAWPVYWIGEAERPWLWVLTAYAGYWGGIKLAQRITGRRWGGDEEGLSQRITGEDDAGVD